MRRFAIILINTFVIILILSFNSHAKTIYTMEELKTKITNNEIMNIWLADGGIGGLEINQYKLVSGEFIVFGSFDKIPDELTIISAKHDVKILPSQRYNDLNPVSSLYIQFFRMILYYSLFIGIFIMLILINRKLSKVLKIISNNRPPS